MDLVDFSQDVFEKIRNDYRDFAARLDLPDLHFIPISALNGDNVVEPSANTPWYKGSTLMHFLESVYIGSDRNLEDFRFPVQYVNRPNLDFRGFCGTIASGIIRVGDEVMALPSRKTSRVKQIVTFEGDLDEAFAPLSVTLTLEDEIDISRGDMIVRPGNVPKLEDKFDAAIVWMSEEPMVPGKSYLIKQTTKAVPGTINTLRYQIDVNTLHRKESPTLKLNEIGRCAVSLSESIAFDAYKRNPATGAFIVIDRISNATVGAGMILQRTTSETRHDHWDDAPQSESLSRHASNVTNEERQARYGQKPATILLTGLPGAGKTTTAFGVERALFDRGNSAMVLDGQNMRMGLSVDLGFSSEDRSENLRRTSETARIVNNAGWICLLALVAPKEDVREKARQVIGDERFFVVHLDPPDELCAQRHKKEGAETNIEESTFEYQKPANADLVLDTEKLSPEECVDAIVEMLQDKKILV